jgi:hypothetical protein
VPIGFSAGMKTAEPSAPRPLFMTNVGSTALNNNKQQYVVSPNGQSFILNSLLEAAQVSPTTIILNWKPRR